MKTIRQEAGRHEGSGETGYGETGYEETRYEEIWYDGTRYETTGHKALKYRPVNDTAAGSGIRRSLFINHSCVGGSLVPGGRIMEIPEGRRFLCQGMDAEYGWKMVLF